MRQAGTVPQKTDRITKETGALLDVRDLRITSRIGGRRRTIVSGIDLTLSPGETIGIVGESGSGKSMTARAILGLLPSGLTASGTIAYDGLDLLGMSERELRRIRGSDISLILQDPYTMLNPLHRCGKHLEETLRLRDGERGLRRRPHREEAIRRLAEVGITDPGVADVYPFQLSGGMRQRVGIAAAIARDPKVLVADEPTTALDVTTQKESLAVLKSLQEKRGMGLILITHDLRVAFAMCDRIYVLYAGSMIELAPAAALEAEPLHPYTLGLLLSEPPGDRRVSTLEAIRGNVPEPDDVSGCCPFAPRCRWVQDDPCTSGRPALIAHSPRRHTACVRIDEIRPEMSGLRQAAEQPGHTVTIPERDRSLVRVTGLDKLFTGGGSGRRAGRTVQALAGVSLDIGAGESVGLVGESGSGKTTLGRCLVGLETPTAGEIVIDGVDASTFNGLTADERTHLRRTVQMIFQDPYQSLNPARTVDFAITEALWARRRRDGTSHRVEARTGELLERVGLPATYGARRPVALSGGERQRVAIARALAMEPRLLVCDEPVSALDVSVQAQVLNLLNRLRQELGIAYLFISHDLAVVRQVVDRVYVLYRGQVVESGPTNEVLDSPTHAYTARLVASIPRPDTEWLEPSPPPAH
ncbi:MAG: dipeptide ABC transporter ATP-binding protein [Nocardioidaceae bacterium]